MKQKNNRILTDDGYLDNRYGKFDRPNFSEKSDMDMKSKMVIPKLSSKDKKNLNTYNYTMQSVIDNGLSKPMKNYEFETELLRGMPSNTTKSYGYRNPSEHYYQYIDDDFQNADNSDLPFPRGGVSTRRSNKAQAKQKFNREIF